MPICSGKKGMIKMELFFELLRYAVTLFFGVFVSASFLNIRMTWQNIFALFSFSILDLSLQALLFLWHSVVRITMLYPLIVHLPLLLLFCLVYRRNLFTSVIAITTAYLCCCTATWISVIAETTGSSPLLVNILYTLILIVTGILVILFIASPFSAILRKPPHALLSFGIFPIFYYIFDYTATIYTEWLYSHNQIAVEFPPLLLCICYLVFCTVYFREYEEKQEMENRTHLIELKQEHSDKEISMMKRNEAAISLLRHDMRHFLNNIALYIEQGDMEKAQEYIYEIIQSVDATSRKKYCANETVNMILSSYEQVIREKQIEFTYNLKIPAELKVSDVDMTSILSNGMENAIHAVCMPDCQHKIIELNMTESGGKLLISLTNTFGQPPQFIDGIPVSRRKDHGFGTHSILYTTEKVKGNCHFTLAGDRFILQIVL